MRREPWDKKYTSCRDYRIIWIPSVPWYNYVLLIIRILLLTLRVVTRVLFNSVCHILYMAIPEAINWFPAEFGRCITWMKMILQFCSSCGVIRKKSFARDASTVLYYSEWTKILCVQPSAFLKAKIVSIEQHRHIKHWSLHSFFFAFHLRKVWTKVGSLLSCHLPKIPGESGGSSSFEEHCSFRRDSPSRELNERFEDFTLLKACLNLFARVVGRHCY